MGLRANTWALMALAAVGCHRDGRDSIRAAPETRARPAPTVPVERPLDLVDSLVGHVGEEVTVEGRAVSSVRVHVPKAVPGKHMAFVDVEGAPIQVVAHVRDVLACPGRVRLTGKVMVAVGATPDGAAYAEPQLDVAGWSCR